MKKKEIINSTAKNGIFKTYIPLVPSEGSMIISKEVNGVQKKFLRGEASNTLVDKADEQVSKSFLNKMVKQLMGVNVFAEHKHDILKTLGFVDLAELSDTGENLIVDTALEPEEDNDLVEKILKKIDHGTKMFYSISGRVTKAIKKFDESLKKTVKVLDDGEIFEVSITALPEGNVDFLSPISKSMHDFMEELGEDNDDIEEVEKSKSMVDEDGNIEWDSIQKALEEMVEYDKLYEQLRDFYWAYDDAVWRITYSDELTPDQKGTKLKELSTEYADKVKEISQNIAEVIVEIESQLTN